MKYLQKIEDAKRLIEQAIADYPNICLGSSFGKDSMVTLHLVLPLKPDIPVICFMADTEFPETYDFTARMVEQYHLNYTEHRFAQDGGKCCGEPKVAIATEALRPYDAWFSGVRSTEGITRAHFEPVKMENGLAKINPILEFTELDIWRYHGLNHLPINPMYQLGYRSLGCSLCSFPEEDESETERAGRWKGTENACGECGIHTQPLR